MRMHSSQRATTWLGLSLLFGLLTACASQEITPLIPNVQVTQKFNGVAVFRLKPDADLERDCAAGSQETDCQVNTIGIDDLALGLRRTFDVVEIGGVEQDFGIAIGTSTAADPSFLSVTSLLLWRGQQLDELKYQLPYTKLMSKRNADEASPIARSITSHIMQDVIRQAMLTPEHVHQRLYASDYANALIAPNEIESFTKYSVHKFVDPLLGAAVRYRHLSPESGHIDVFVYPVRAIEWQDVPTVLTQESKSVRRDLTRLKDQGVHQLVRLNDDEMLHWSGVFGSIDLLRFEGEIANADFQPYDTSTYLYLDQDKLVKIRSTTPRNAPISVDSAQFVRSLMATLQVPPESQYMRQARQRWLNNRSQQ
jgi:hypothetical protein